MSEDGNVLFWNSYLYQHGNLLQGYLSSDILARIDLILTFLMSSDSLLILRRKETETEEKETGKEPLLPFVSLPLLSCMFYSYLLLLWISIHMASLLLSGILIFGIKYFLLTLWILKIYADFSLCSVSTKP